MKKILLIILLGLTIILSGCSGVEVSKLDQEKVNEAIILYADDKNIKEFLKENNIDINNYYVNESSEIKPTTKKEKRKDLKAQGQVSCFDKKNAKKKGECYNNEGDIIFYDDDIVRFQQINLGHGPNFGLFDDRAWSASITKIKNIEIVSTSQNYDLTFINDLGTGKKKTFTNLNKSVALNTNFNYKSDDKKLYILINDKEHNDYKPNYFQIYIEGEKLK